MDVVGKKRVTKSMRRKLHAGGFPTFERTPSGALLQLKIVDETLGWKGEWHRRKNPTRQSAIEWCEKNIKGRYIPQNLFVFELYEDYVLARLIGYFEAVKSTRVV